MNTIDNSIRNVPLAGKKIFQQSLVEKADLNKNNFFKNIFKILFILCVIGGIGFFAMSTVFTKAEIIITPVKKQINLDIVLKATNQGSEKISEDVIFYEIISLSETGSKNLIATDEKKVESKASGLVMLYNEYSSSVITLREETR
jgi:hypothetical protein